jgi:hypothetical protein
MKRVVLVWGVLMGCQQAPSETGSETVELRPAPASLQDEIDRDQTRILIRLRERPYCGATIARRVVLIGQGATIVACPNGPAPVPGLPQLQAGILLSPGADGSVFEDLRFEGRGVARDQTSALSFGIFARGVANVRVLENRFDGTVQAVTDTAGAGWLVERNRVHELEVFGCNPGLCGGGDAIVLAHARAGDGSADDSIVRGNRISTLAPPAGLPFAVDGVLAFSVERPFIADNEIAMQGSPTIGIEFTRTTGGGFIDAPCGNGTIIENHVRGADTDVDVASDCASGTVDIENRAAALIVAGASGARPLGLDYTVNSRAN